MFSVIGTIGNASEHLVTFKHCFPRGFKAQPPYSAAASHFVVKPPPAIFCGQVDLQVASQSYLRQVSHIQGMWRLRDWWTHLEQGRILAHSSSKWDYGCNPLFFPILLVWYSSRIMLNWNVEEKQSRCLGKNINNQLCSGLVRVLIWCKYPAPVQNYRSV